MTGREKGKRIGLAVLIAALDLLLGPGALYAMKQTGVDVCLVSHAGEMPGQFLAQSLLLSVLPLSVFLLYAFKLRMGFADAMYLRVRGRLAGICVGILALMLTIMAALAVRRTGDPLQVVLSLLYYLVFVALAEEFVTRGVLPYVLRGMDWKLQYLLPSFLFAMLHILAYNDFRPLDLEYLWHFARYHLLGLMASGCCLYIFKVRTGTLWVPILLHTMVDFMAVR